MGGGRTAKSSEFCGSALKKNFIKKKFLFLARCKEKICITTIQNENFDRNEMKMQKSNLPSFAISIFQKNWIPEKKKSAFQNPKLDDAMLNFLVQNLILKKI